MTAETSKMSIKSAGSKAGALVHGVGEGLSLMTAAEKRMAVVLLFTSLVNGVLQTATILVIVPVIQLMINSGAMPKGWHWAWIEAWLSGPDRKTILVEMAAAIGVLIVVKGVFAWAQLGWMSRFSAHCEVRLGSFLMKRILVAPYAWLVRQNSARLRELLFGFVSVWSRDFIRSSMRLVNDLLFAGFIIAVLIWANPLSGVLVAGGAALLGGVMFILVRPELFRLALAKRKGIFGANSISTEAVLGVKEVKMAGAEDRFAALFDAQVEIYADADANAQQWIQAPRVFLEVLAYGALVGLSAIVVLSDTQIPDLGALLLLYGLSAVRLLPIFSGLVSSLTVLVGSFPVMSDLKQLIAATDQPESAPPPGLIAPDWREVRLENVTFLYDGGEGPALNNVSLHIDKGGTYGVVGPSGAGKSTLVDVIAGLLEPSFGTISLDGQALAPEHQRAWRRRFGYVAQRPFLMDASLRENIIFGSPAPIDPDKLQRAITLAKLDGVVGRLPGGLKGRVGEQGALLSGGERQRVAIARALYRGADVLILDEATSSLDTLVEQEIAESIASLHGAVTTIIVSHRLGLVRACDEIWVFDSTRLTARGRHEELMTASSLYRRMVTQTDEIAA